MIASGPILFEKEGEWSNTRYRDENQDSHYRMMFPKTLKNKEKINLKKVEKRC